MILPVSRRGHSKDTHLVPVVAFLSKSSHRKTRWFVRDRLAEEAVSKKRSDRGVKASPSIRFQQISLDIYMSGFGTLHQLFQDAVQFFMAQKDTGTDVCHRMSSQKCLIYIYIYIFIYDIMIYMKYTYAYTFVFSKYMCVYIYIYIYI